MIATPNAITMTTPMRNHSEPLRPPDMNNSVVFQIK
jgi:hypothetical protein